MPELQINIKDEVTSFEAMRLNTYAIAAMDQKPNMIVYKRGSDQYIAFLKIAQLVSVQLRSYHQME